MVNASYDGPTIFNMDSYADIEDVPESVICIISMVLI